MSRTTILFGPPGCGKTTALLGEVEKALDSGVDPERIGYFAFTRKAAEEAVTRAGVRFGLSGKQLPWFRTLHSAAFRLLGLKPDDVLRTEDYHTIGESLGPYTFTAKYSEVTERPPIGGGLGDRALNIYALARARGITVQQAWHENPLMLKITLQDVTHFDEAVRAYKKTTGQLEFCDFMDIADGNLDFDLFIIDEAQDLTRQQWTFARRLGRNARQVFLAGDDDQCIYQWAGADYREFLSFVGHQRVLPQSYRLPRLLWQYANEIAARIKVRHEKVWQPREQEGELLVLDNPEQVTLRGSETWLFLVRHRAQIKPLVKLCREQGVVYHYFGQWSNQTTPVRAVVDYERLRRGETLTMAQANRVIRYIPNMDYKTVPVPHDWDTMEFPFLGRPDWMTALTDLPPEEKGYIRRLRLENEPLSSPGRVVLSTIHGAKGSEADNVVLLPDYNRTVYQMMVKDPDQEVRVWYVGSTRAKLRLFLVRPRTRLHFGGL